MERLTKDFLSLFKDLKSYIEDKFNYYPKLKIVFIKNNCNAENILCKTAFYDPKNKKIAIYISKRHPKDCLRSFCHEWIHAYQDYENKFKNISSTEEGYAQKNPYLRNMEKEAFLKGNMIFRDWEDQRKKQIKETIYIRENKNMKKEYKFLETWKEDIFVPRHKKLMQRLFENQGINLKEKEDSAEKIAKTIEATPKNDLDDYMRNPSLSKRQKSEILKNLRKDEQKDKIKGGLADKKPDSQFDSKELAKGIEVELEHTKDVELAKEIAKDHLMEDPQYYDKLEKMESGELDEQDLPKLTNTNIDKSIKRHEKKINKKNKNQPKPKLEELKVILEKIIRKHFLNK